MPKIRTPRRIERAGRRRQGTDIVPYKAEKLYCATPVEREVLTERSLALRLEGRTYEQIAKIIGYSYKRTYDFVQAALARRHDITNELAARLRKESIEQLDQIYAAHADNVGDYKSAMVMLKVHERKAQLVGLDAPEALIFQEKKPEQEYDLSKLSLEELRALRVLLTKAAAVSVMAEAETTVDAALGALAKPSP
jgi:predicted nucleic acid-binding protein